MDGNVVPAGDNGGTPGSPYGTKAQLFLYSAPFPLPLYIRRDVVERICARNEGLDAERPLSTQTEPRLDTRFFRFFFGWTRYNYCSFLMFMGFHARTATIYYSHTMILERP